MVGIVRRGSEGQKGDEGDRFGGMERETDAWDPRADIFLLPRRIRARR